MSAPKKPAAAIAGQAIGSLSQAGVMAWAAVETTSVLRWCLWVFVALILIGHAVTAASKGPSA